MSWIHVANSTHHENQGAVCSRQECLAGSQTFIVCSRAERKYSCPTFSGVVNRIDDVLVLSYLFHAFISFVHHRLVVANGGGSQQNALRTFLCIWLMEPVFHLNFFHFEMPFAFLTPALAGGDICCYRWWPLKELLSLFLVYCQLGILPVGVDQFLEYWKGFITTLCRKAIIGPGKLCLPKTWIPK